MAKVLVVDDDIGYRGFLSALITGAGHDVTEAVNGLDALSHLSRTTREGTRRFKPDLVLCDFNMGKMGGFELIQKIKEMQHLRKVPLVMITGTEKDIRELVEFEGVKFVKKTSSGADILKTLAPLLPVAAPPPNDTPKGPVDPTSSTPPTAMQPSVPPALPAAGVEPTSTQPGAMGEPPAASAPAAGAAPSGEEDELIYDPNSSRFQELASELTPLIESSAADDKIEEAALKEEESSQIIRLVNGILLEAVRLQASDIHIEPQTDMIYVRVRIDGQLKCIMKIPLALMPNIAARVKVVSSMNLTERRLPQDGRFSIRPAPEQLVEFRVNTLPAQFGEKVVMRLLRHEKVNKRLRDLFERDRDLDAVSAALSAPTGLILVVGPTGSGKTTTLYTMLDVLNKPNKNIITVEDPVENEVQGITQVPVRQQIGLSFDKVLRACLRQDPNIIMVGEIRDAETAEIALKAAMTGHLVLSTLHANTAPMAVYRLSTMGLKPFLVVAALKLVISQRLLRRLCAHCKAPGAGVPDEFARQLQPEELAGLKTHYEAKGCKKCDNIGYKGRHAVMEVMTVRSHEMRELIMECKNSDAILEQAKKEGLLTLRQQALALAAAGETSVAEAFTIYYAE